MARIIDPKHFDAQGDLIKAIKTKHDEDGGESVLTQFLAEQEIDLDEDVNSFDAAKVFNNQQSSLSKKAEELRKERDLKFNPVFKDHKDMVQFLKMLYKPNVNRLGEWGVTVDNENRIVYPTVFSARVGAVQNFVTKSNSFTPATNPLKPYFTVHNTNIASLPPLLASLLELNADFENKRREAEEATAERNGLMEPVIKHYQSIGNYLKKLFNKNPKKLGNWGFVVDDSPRAPKNRNSTIKLGQQITIQGVTIGGTLFNTGTVEVKVYKGKTASGEFTTVLPNQTMGIEKGFSIITIVNPSLSTSAKVKVLANQ